jgi:hypothetical protein
MTQAPEVEPLHIFWNHPQPRGSMDSQRVCEIVGQVAAEVLSEVRAGTWHPPTTLRIYPQLRGSQLLRERRRDSYQAYPQLPEMPGADQQPDSQGLSPGPGRPLRRRPGPETRSTLRGPRPMQWALRNFWLVAMLKPAMSHVTEPGL